MPDITTASWMNGRSRLASAISGTGTQLIPARLNRQFSSGNGFHSIHMLLIALNSPTCISLRHDSIVSVFFGKINGIGSSLNLNC